MRQFILVVLSSAVFCSAIGVVVARHDTRKLFVEIQALEKQRDDLNEEWGRLQLEQSTWATDTRIESIARTDLQMITPKATSVRLITQ